MFYAKPSGTYAYNSTEGTANIKAVYDYLFPEGFTKNCIIGILGNVGEESGYNPWLWENDTYNPANGYGLFQFTPGSDYLNASGIPNHAPNTDTSQASPGASPDDAKGQLYCVANDVFAKWVDTCWRSYWNPSDYPDLYIKHTYILNTYGNGSHLSFSQFKAINDYSDACFAFLACYEGPGDYLNPLDGNYLRRLAHAANCKSILDNYSGTLDILIMKKIIDRNFGRRIL